MTRWPGPWAYLYEDCSLDVVTFITYGPLQQLAWLDLNLNQASLFSSPLATSCGLGEVSGLVASAERLEVKVDIESFKPHAFSLLYTYFGSTRINI